MSVDRRSASGTDDSVTASAAFGRRQVPRGGRRATDIAGRFPPVLVGDSDERARRVFVRALDRFGFDVIEAADGEEALRLVETCSPGAVIAELTLPRDDRFQDYVRSHGIPYIVTVTTDVSSPPDGVVAVLEKPFSLDVLLDAVFGVLRSGKGTGRGVASA
jgi:DNA-binding response OmpR family regulator